MAAYMDTSAYLDDFPRPVPVKPGEHVEPPTELSDLALQQIHAGLLIPSPRAIHSMARELRKWRGVKDPDLV